MSQALPIEPDNSEPPPTEKDHAALLDKSIELPNLPEVAWKVRDAMASKDTSVEDIALIVQNDPAISARLIQVANSPLYSGLVKAENLRTVVGRLGLNCTQNLVTLLAVKQLFRAQTDMVKERLKTLYDHSTTTAALCAVIASKLPSIDKDRAALCGLLHDIGVIPVLTRVDKQPQFFESAEQLEHTVAELRVQVGTWVLKKWNFDSEFIDVVREARNVKRDKLGPIDYCDVVVCALLLKQTMLHVEVEPSSIHDLPIGAKLAENGLLIVSNQDFIDEASDQIDSIRASLI